MSIKDLFHTGITKSMRLEEFEQTQNQSCMQVLRLSHVYFSLYLMKIPFLFYHIEGFGKSSHDLIILFLGPILSERDMAEDLVYTCARLS